MQKSTKKSLEAEYNEIDAKQFGLRSFFASRPVSIQRPCERQAPSETMAKSPSFPTIP
jgi:hypothetical protein